MFSNVSHTFPWLRKKFDLSRFFQINRSDLISIEVIESIQLVKKQYIIKLKPDVVADFDIKVSRNNSRAFKKWYDSFNVPND
ncbi:LytTR family transcriptional regulator DNA-binding domain-containing protein [Pedobacter sp. L105]|uniref:LytTR family transcriptional regulator DNA-binding domain-containing protein n=1 Tax=Pedobacter sp. L105 TaxID=1641871 RepID=UPI00131D699E|nr:LytTR family transcriptional regulator DNA-binding domain-containing protein [Pedobacter sp. L105]